MSTPDPTNNSVPTADERNMALFAHLAALAGLLIPLGNIIGPLIIWLTQKDKSAYVADQGAESLNFQITATIIGAVLMVLAFTIIGLVVAIPGFLILGVGVLVLVIMAAIATSKGERYRYPFNFRLIK